jgi:group I intron endonuclease
MIGIYKITNPKGKVYIGQSVDIEDRFKQYRYLKCKKQIRLYRSFKKYSIDNHNFEILENCNIDELNERERYYQNLYDVIGKKGLNCRLTKTDDKSGFMSEKTKKKMSKSMTGRKKSKECIEKSIKFHTGRKRSEQTKLNISNSLKGRVINEEWRNKISKSKKGKKTRIKKVINLLTNEIYNSAKEAYIYSNYSYSGFVKCLNGNRKNLTNFKYLKNE